MQRIYSLKSMINISLKEGQMTNGFENSLLSAHKTQVLNKDENEYWDYKEDIDLNKESDIAKLAKYTMGFHNLKGGVLIFGVSNDFKVKGFNKNKTFDSIRIRNKIRKYLSKEILVFQNQIDVNDNKILWLIFVPPHLKESPVQVKEDYTDNNSGKKILIKSHYIIRDGDQFKFCIDPFDYDRCFADLNHSHLYAYLNDIDEPYFRLLTPHQDRFFGRGAILESIFQVYNTRSYIIALDGLGGVGKSAIAIEFVKKLYQSRTLDFIISLSAKNRVWDGKIGSRHATISGLHELVIEVAKILQIDILNKNLDALKNEVIQVMAGLNGLLFIDNFETINTADVIAFVEQIPSPVKILITTKVVKDIPAKTISIPEMEENEALELFYFELEKVGYNNYITEMKEVKELILRTNYFPLAIKWAASLAIGKKNLREVLNNFKQLDSNKKEFLSFCFSSIYDELSQLAKECAQLIPYLGEKWNQFMLSIALNKSPQEIEDAIFELGERGILMTTRHEHKKNIIVLPLTTDYLSNKYHENQILRSRINLNISSHLVSKTNNLNVTDIFAEIETLLEVLKESASLLIEKKEFQKALPIIQLALQTIREEKKAVIDSKYFGVFKFLEGKMNYENKAIRQGLSQMKQAYYRIEKIAVHDSIYLGEALLTSGSIDDRELGIKLIMDNFNKIQNINQITVQELFDYYLETQLNNDPLEEETLVGKNDRSFIEKLISRVNYINPGYFVVKELRTRNLMPDLHSELYLRDHMKKCLKIAVDAPQIDDDMRKFILDYEKKYFK